MVIFSTEQRFIRYLLLGLLVLQLVGATLAEDEIVKSPSPDGKYALRLVKDSDGNASATIIDVKSKAVVVDELDEVPHGHLKSAELVWSADSKRVAFRRYSMRYDPVSVYIWDGTKFAEVELPDLPMPEPKKPKPSKAEVDHQRLEFDAAMPQRWLKSGSLELTHAVSFVLLYEDGTGENLESTLLITIGFDDKHHATVQKSVPVKNSKKSDPPED
jgi:hypothetical protein